VWFATGSEIIAAYRTQEEPDEKQSQRESKFVR
jgi:hypothetical protein